MQIMLDFNRTMLLLPLHWRIWVGLLVVLNFLTPIFFITIAEGQVVLGMGMVAIVIQLIIFSRLGFVRLLGLGHAPWIWLVYWLWGRLDTAEAGGALSYWLAALIAINCASLLIDVVNVLRFIRGERAPTLSLGTP